LTIKDFDRYTDSMLQAAILRCATPSELQRSQAKDEGDREKWCRGRLRGSSKTDEELRRELLISILMEKMPRATIDATTLAKLRVKGLGEFCSLYEGDLL
jgi:hypothetical protein